MAEAVVAEAVDDHRAVDVVVDVRQPLVGLRLVVEGVTAAVVAVAGDEVPGFGGVHSGCERLGGEAREDDRVRRADPGTRQHRDRQFRYHRHVHRDDVVLLDAEVAEGRGELVDLAVEVLVGVRPGVSVLAFPLDRDAVLVAVLDVAVDTVVRGVQRPVSEPLVERLLGVVEYLGVLLVPVEKVGRAGPTLRPVLLELVVDRLVGHVRLLDEFVAGLERFLLGQSRFELSVTALVRHRRSQYSSNGS